jgi:hypothetical protein
VLCRRTDGPAAAVGVVAVGTGQAVASDGPGIAFNAQVVTIAAQIAAAEASGRAAGGPAVVGPSGHPTGAVAACVAGRMAALRVPRAAGWAVERQRAVRRGRKPRHEAAAGGPAGMPALWGWAGAGPGRAGGELMIPGLRPIPRPPGRGPIEASLANANGRRASIGRRPGRFIAPSEMRGR